jgi:membrane protein
MVISVPQYNSERNLAFVVTLLFPFWGLIYSLYHWRASWAKNTFWLACIYMGMVQIFHPEGTILGDGADGGRYVLDLISMHVNVHSFTDVAKVFYDGSTLDVYQKTLTFIVSRFTDNGHVLFFFFAVVFGFFYSRNIWYVLDKLPEKFNKYLWVLILFYFLVCPIWLINGVRMWTATHVFVYGAMPYVFERNKSKLIWCLASILVHHSFIFPILILVIFSLIPQNSKISKKTLTLLFLFYLVSLFVKTVNLTALADTLTQYLPDYYDNRITGYVNEDALERRLDAATQLSWHVSFAQQVGYWIIQILIIMSFFALNKVINKSKWIIPLFMFSLLMYGASNILSYVPSGGRYLIIAQMFMIPSLLLILTRVQLHSYLKTLLPLCMFCLVFTDIFEIRKLFDFYGITLLVGNFITMFFVESNTPLITLVKQIF